MLYEFRNCYFFLVKPGSPQISKITADAFSSQIEFSRAREMTCFGTVRIPLLTKITIIETRRLPEIQTEKVSKC